MMLSIWAIYILTHVAFLFIERFTDQKKMSEVENKVIVTLGVILILCVLVGGAIEIIAFLCGTIKMIKSFVKRICCKKSNKINPAGEEARKNMESRKKNKNEKEDKDGKKNLKARKHQANAKK